MAEVAEIAKRLTLEQRIVLKSPLSFGSAHNGGSGRLSLPAHVVEMWRDGLIDDEGGTSSWFLTPLGKAVARHLEHADPLKARRVNPSPTGAKYNG